MKIAILSDLHAAPKTSPPNPDIKLFTDGTEHHVREHPLAALRELIRANDLHVNMIVCPGDMADRANSAGLQYVWKELHELRSQLNATSLIATVGNHDVDSRDVLGEELPRETLMKLKPTFPIDDERLADRYWAHGYCMTSVDDVRVLVLNSCWLHESAKDLNRGTVTRYTIEKIRRELTNHPSPKRVSVAVMHHHPLMHADHNLGQDDVMKNGQEFLSLLNENGPWLVIHGHKHHPRIVFAQSQDMAPLIFASGSFSGRLEGNNARVSQNMFHIVDLLDPESGLRGRVTSWAFIPGNGWQYFNGPEPDQFSCDFGFGYFGSIETLAAAIDSQMTGKQLMKWSELTQRVPDVPFLLPKQFRRLSDLLESKYKLLVQLDAWGRPTQLGKQEP